MKALLLITLVCLSIPLFGQQTAQTAPDTALHYVLMNDTSGKTLWPKGIEQQVSAETQFLKQVIRPGVDVGTVVNFAEDFWLDLENSTDPEAISAKLIRRGRNGTKLFEAVVAASDWLAEDPSDKRKAIFVFSDGDDNASQMTLQSTIAAVQKTHIPVFVISPSAVEHHKQGKDMKQLANATGGHAYFAHNSEGFDFSVLKRDLGR
jgi:hypothetical protein